MQTFTSQTPLCALFMLLCASMACTNLYSPTVTLLSRLQEGISTYRPTINAFGRGVVQQTGRVDLLQEPAELLLTAAAEQLWIHNSKRRDSKNKERECKYWLYSGFKMSRFSGVYVQVRN